MSLKATRCAYIKQLNSEIDVLVDTVPLTALLPPENIDKDGQLSLGPAEVLIKVRAVALSSLDTEVYEGQWQFNSCSAQPTEDHRNNNNNNNAFPPPLPFVTGYEFSGVVVSVGSAVARMNDLLVENNNDNDSNKKAGGRQLSGQATVRKGQAVVGLAPIDRRLGCMSEYTVQNVSCLVPKPALVLHEDDDSIIGPGLRAMTALHYHISTHVGDTLLVVQGASPTGRVAIQLAVHLGLRVLAMGDTAKEINYLEDLGARLGSSQRGSLVRVIDTRNGPDLILSQVMEETGHMGVDGVFEADTSNCTSSKNSESKSRISSGGDEDGSSDRGSNITDDGNDHTDLKRTMLECLGTNGAYITTRRDLQLDPGESQRLALKGGSLSFVFEQTWVLSPCKQGKYLHIMNQVMNYLADGTLGTLVGGDCTSLGRAREAYRSVQKGTDVMGRAVIKIE
jgi:NADPH:quinone reductase-like Zn-dependent oxidoreductase